MCKKIFLTGLPGCGKTTVVRKVVEILLGNVCGFYTEEVRDAKNRRIGFRVVALNGSSGVLASRIPGHGPRVGSYLVNVESFERIALPSLEVGEGMILVIDEIGKMECRSGKFVRRVREILQTDSTVLATVPFRGGGEFPDEVRRMNSLKSFTVTRENRDVLPTQIAAMLSAIVQERNV